MFFSNIQRKTKGEDRVYKQNAKGNAKIIMPIIGLKNSPLADATKILPTIGAVQEKVTRTNVKAIKNIPRSPPWWDFLSTEVIKLEGIVNS